MMAFLPPSTREAVGRGLGGLSTRTTLPLRLLKLPPPPTPPRYALRAWEEGRIFL
jgi:hypothetical protein